MPLSSDTRPTDFDSYWRDTLQELARIPPAPEVEIMPIRSTDFATMYGVRLTSIGPYRLFAYLSIPHGVPPFPAVMFAPNYGSVVQPLPQGAPSAFRNRHITFSLGVRGQRNSDRPFAASFPGLLTEGIDDPSSYVYRAIVADCLRGVVYLTGRSEVDPDRVAIVGADLALIVAGLSPRLTHLICTPGMFYKTAEYASATTEYPVQEINDYLRLNPRKRAAVHSSLSYLDPRWFAPSVQATTLINCGGDGDLLDRRVLQPLLAALGEKASFHATEHSSYKDGLFDLRWLATAFGFSEAIVPEHWQ